MNFPANNEFNFKMNKTHCCCMFRIGANVYSFEKIDRNVQKRISGINFKEMYLLKSCKQEERTYLKNS